MSERDPSVYSPALPLAAVLLLAGFILYRAPHGLGILGALFTFVSFVPVLSVGLGWNRSVAIVGLLGLGVLHALMLDIPAVFLTMLAGFVALRSAQYRVIGKRRYDYPIGFVLRDLFGCVSLVCVLGLSVLSLVWADAGLSQFIRVELSEDLNRIAMTQTPQVEQVLAFIGTFLPALFLGTWGLILFASVQGASVLLDRLGRPTRLCAGWDDIVLPHAYAYLWAGSVLGAFIPLPDVRYISLNVCLILMMGFWVQGLAVLHVWVMRRVSSLSTQTSQKGINPRLFLWLTYIFMIVFPGFLLLVMGIGVLDHVLALRRPRS